MSRVSYGLILWAVLLAPVTGAQNPDPPASAPGQAAAPSAQNPATAALLERQRAAMEAFLRGRSSWGTAGADAQRSWWVHTDPKISREGVQKPDFKFLWKIKLPGAASDANSLSPAVLLNRYIGYRGFRNLAFVANSGVAVYGIDVDLGRIEWTVNDPQASAGSCAAGTLNGVARPLNAAFSSPAPAPGFGRGGPAQSAVGAPYAGAVTLAQAGRFGFSLPPPGAMAGRSTPTPVPPSAASPSGAPLPGRGDANAPGVPGSGGPLVRPPRTPVVIYVLTADGMLHTMYVSNGQEPKSAIPFLPRNSAAQGFIVVNDIAYAVDISCSGGASALVSLDIQSGAKHTWNAPSEIAGQLGPAFGPDGTVYVSTTGGDLFALDPKALTVRDTLSLGEPLASSPVIFQYGRRVLGCVATKRGRLVLFDTKSLGGDDHRTPLFKTLPNAGQSFSSITLASWMDNGGRRWIVLPARKPGKGAIAAWLVQEQGGTLRLNLGWRSSEIPSPSPAMIINGVVFAASNADPGSAGKRRRSPSVIYALDGLTGKELWNSGKSITSSAYHGSLSGGGSQIYLGTDDGNLYAFGAWIEREISP
jgi:outer membrane protein assembly factor BamB